MEEIKKWVIKKVLKIFLCSDNLLNKLIAKASILYEGKHPKHRLTNYHNFFIDNIKDKSSVLDIGCGNGLLSIDIGMNRNCDVIGIDKNKKVILEAIDRVKNLKNIPCSFLWEDATKIKIIKNETYDYIVLSNVLEHIEDRIPFLKSIKPIGGIFLIRVPVINRDWKVLYKKEFDIEYRLDKTHFIEYTIDSFKKELDIAGYKIQSYDIQFGEIWAVVKRK